MSGRSGFFASAAVVVALAGAAQGQTALGDGGALDANPRLGAGGRNSAVRDLAAELRFRNAIVTGNAPQGLSFRGDIPYAAPGEFRGASGSDDLFAFRRDTLYSGLAGMGIRGTEALQQQFALTSGSHLPELLSGTLIVNRYGATARTLQPPFPAAAGGIDADAPLQRVVVETPDDAARESGLATLRSTSAYTATRGTQPALLDVRTTPNGDLIGVSASPLTGIRAVPLGKAPAQGQQPGSPQQQPPQGAAPADLSATASAPSGRQDLSAQNIPGPRGIVTAHDDLLERFERYEDQLRRLAQGDEEPEPGALWTQRLGEIRSLLLTPEGQTIPAPAAAQPPLGEATRPAVPGGGLIDPFADVPGARRFTFDPLTVEILRNAPGEVVTLQPASGGGMAAYREHMRLGEEALSRGRFFDAEESFTRALAVRPGDTMAMVGRAHAQLGAGMYLSAWINLQSLFREHPEVIGVRYGGGLLPQAERADHIKRQLRASIRDRVALERESALLLAYIGYQTGDQAAVEEGLRVLPRDGDEDALDALLRAVWAGEAKPER